MSCFNGKRHFFLQEDEGSNFKTSEEKSFKLRTESEDPGMKNMGAYFIVSPNTAALSHKEHASTGTFR